MPCIAVPHGFNIARFCGPWALFEAGWLDWTRSDRPGRYPRRFSWHIQPNCLCCQDATQRFRVWAKKSSKHTAILGAMDLDLNQVLTNMAQLQVLFEEGITLLLCGGLLCCFSWMKSFSFSASKSPKSGLRNGQFPSVWLRLGLLKSQLTKQNRCEWFRFAPWTLLLWKLPQALCCFAGLTGEQIPPTSWNGCSQGC